MAKHKYYKYNTVTGEVVEEYLESAEDTLILMQNPLIDKSIDMLQETSVDIIATSWDTDYRLSEVEWALEDNGILSTMLFNINTKNIKGGNTMALTKFEQAQIMILGGAYNRVTLTRQLDRYLEKKVITQVEYDELISLMDAKELVTGE